MENTTIPAVLVFSGLDPSGGAGIQADIEALVSQGCHVCPVITSLTVQDTSEFQGLTAVSADLVHEQARRVLNDIPVAAIKIGMIGNVPLIHKLRQLIDDYPDLPVILDPVLASGSGTPVADAQYVKALVEELLPVTNFLTPNHLEARTLAAALGCHSQSMAEYAQALLDQNVEYILITGGHEETPEITNRLFHDNTPVEVFQWQRLPGEFHGTGCTLTASIAGLIAQGQPPLTAIQQAQEYTWACLQSAYHAGSGQAIPNRLFWADTRLNRHRETQNQP